MSQTGVAKFVRWFRAILLPLLVALITILLSGCADSNSQSLTPSAEGAHTPVEARDIKLLADFQEQKLYSRGRPVYLDALKTQGAAGLLSEEGLSVYKGGVNEIIDPSFEGAGWRLFTGAAIDSSTASVGKKSLKVTADGTTVAVVARLGNNPVVPTSSYFDTVTGEQIPASRSLAFDQSCTPGASGRLEVRLIARSPDGAPLGESSSAVDVYKSEWNRNRGIIFALPEGVASYGVEVGTRGFKGSCNLDAFQVEPRDFTTPYFDGDSDNSLWVSAAPPTAFHGARNIFDSRKLFKVVLLALITLALGSVTLFLMVLGVRRDQWRLFIIPPLLSLPLIPLLLIAGGFITMPGWWPVALSVPASTLKPDQVYYYRITSIDAEGRESPPSPEYRVKTTWLERAITLGWVRDPQAMGYRVYRGENSYTEDLVREVPGGEIQTILDSGEGWSAGMPPIELTDDTGAPHASRSLRPNPDARISNTRLGLDVAEDFWVAGEVEFDFSNAEPYRPASFFEIGDPGVEAQFAVSTRFFPAWGDEASHIILIKGGTSGWVDTTFDVLPVFQPGAAIRYVAAQLFTASGDLPAGVHLWYRIDQGEVRHITAPNIDPLGGKPYIHISKRYFYDEFGNNSICRSFAIIQGKVDSGAIETVMGPGTVPERLQVLVGT